METNAIQGSQASYSPLPSSAGPQLGREDFLKLLITQLQMQDPFQPMDNEDMIAQLATFSSLEQLEQMNSGLKDGLDMDLLLGQLLNNTMATNLIGRNAHVASDKFSMEKDDSVTIGYRLKGPAQSVSIKIYDKNDNVVRVLESEGISATSHTVEWDGTDEHGDAVKPGDYRYEVEADGPGDSRIDLTSYLVGLVDGIRYRDGQAWLVVGADEFAMGTVLEVMQP